MLRPLQYTVAPASPNATAIPRPAPRVAPSAVLELRHLRYFCAVVDAAPRTTKPKRLPLKNEPVPARAPM